MSPENHKEKITSVCFLILVLLPTEILSGEYGELCVTSVDCISADTRNPLICYNPAEPPTTTEEPPTTTEEPTTTTEEPTTTTEEPTTTTDEPTTTEEPTITTEEPQTTTEEPTTTTEEPTTTTEEPTTTTEEPTITTEEPQSTTEEPTATTEEPTTTTEKPASASNRILPDFDNFRTTPFENLENAYGVCSCPASMIIDEKLKRCVSPPLGDCDLRYGDGNFMRTCARFSKCYPKSETGPDGQGTCACDQDAKLDNVVGVCKLSYGSTKCQLNTDCDIRTLLACKNHTCDCMYDDLQKWNPKEEACGFIVGKSCDDDRSPFPRGICVENAVCPDGTKICECDNGYKVTPEGLCKLPYNAPCEEDSACHPFFKCVENVCTCSDGQSYFNSTDMCHIPEGTPCTASSSACTPQAICENEVCLCESGYQATSENTCHALFNSKCSNDVPCHLDSYLDTCNISQPFCRCKEKYQYNSATGRCVGNLYEACRVDDDCIEHAICQEESCLCGGDYIPGQNKTACYTHYGKPCSNIACYPGHFLKCDGNDFTCICASDENQVFDETKGYCVALAERSCGDSVGGIECIKDSVCGVEEKCKCYAGYAANSTGFCLPVEDVNSTASPLFENIHVPIFSLILSSALLLLFRM